MDLIERQKPNNDKMNRYRIIGIIIYVAGFGMFIGSLFVYYNTQTFIEKSFSATGTVIDVTTPNYGGSWYILMSFETAKNESVQIKLYDSSDTPAHVIGDKVPILYDPHRCSLKLSMDPSISSY